MGIHRRLICCLLLLHAQGGQASISEKTFNAINQTIYDIYASKIRYAFDSELSLVAHWSDYGSAFKVDSTWRLLTGDQFLLTLTGLMPHKKEITEEGYAIVACHEIGHMMGGEPRQKNKLSGWSSVEGQADYYATNNCMWTFLERNGEGETLQQDELYSLKCQETFFDKKDQINCLRIMSGVISLANYFNMDRDETKRVDIGKSDQTVAKETLEKYPPHNQCRIDTFIAGLFGEARPVCWYKG